MLMTGDSIRFPISTVSLAFILLYYVKIRLAVKYQSLRALVGRQADS